MKKIVLISCISLLSAQLFANGGKGEAKKEESSSTLETTKVEGPGDPVEKSAAVADPAKQVKRPTGIRLSGFSRLVGFYRDLDTYYPGTVTLRGLTVPRTLSIGDGSANPAFMLAMEVNPTSNTSVLVETALHHNFLAATSGVINNNQGGTASSIETGKIASVFSRFGVNATTTTKVGTFKMIAGGGMNWAKISPFTLWTFQYRDDMFERYPWDPAGSNWRRYSSYYSSGDIPRDLRWGNRSTQGFNIVAEDLPYGLEAKLLIGKTSLSGGWQNYLTGLPQNVVAGGLSKQIGPVKAGLNYFNQYGFDQTSATIDTAFVFDGEKYNVNTNRTSQLIMTTDGKFSIKGKVRVYYEIGTGSYLSRTHWNTSDTARMTWSTNEGRINKLKRYWSPIAYAEFDVDKSLFNFPFKSTLFYVGREAVNNASAILNSANEEATDGRNLNDLGAGQNNQLYFEGMITEIGQVTNNRWGTSFKYKKKLGALGLEANWSMQQEIENLALDSTVNGTRLADADLNGMNGVRNSVSLYHIVNQFQRSRFDFINRFVGPYNRLQSDFRRSWENIAITDSVEAITYKKAFSTLELSAKYKTNLFKKELIVSAFGRANSVQETPSPIPFFGEKAFVRQWYEEFMAFYHIHNRVTLIGFLAFEQVKGNERTELAWSEDSELAEGQEDLIGELILNDNGTPAANGDIVNGVEVTGGKPIDQRGIGYGIGLDYDFATNACLDVRYRRYAHEDLVFLRDEFKGQEITVELKVFF